MEKCTKCFGKIVNGVCQSCKTVYTANKKYMDKDTKNRLISKHLELAKMQHDAVGNTDTFFKVSDGVYCNIEEQKNITLYIADDVGSACTYIGTYLPHNTWGNLKVIGGRGLRYCNGLLQNTLDNKAKYESIDIELFDTSKLENASSMLNDTEFKCLDLSCLDFSKVSDFSYFMQNVRADRVIIGNDLSWLKDASYAFNYAEIKYLEIELSKGLKAETAEGIFEKSKIGTLKIKAPDLYIENMTVSFAYANIEKFDVETVLHTRYARDMFYDYTGTGKIDTSCIGAGELRSINTMFQLCGASVIDMTDFHLDANAQIDAHDVFGGYSGRVITHDKMIIDLIKRSAGAKCEIVDK